MPCWVGRSIRTFIRVFVSPTDFISYKLRVMGGRFLLQVKLILRNIMSNIWRITIGRYKVYNGTSTCKRFSFLQAGIALFAQRLFIFRLSCTIIKRPFKLILFLLLHGEPVRPRKMKIWVFLFLKSLLRLEPTLLMLFCRSWWRGQCCFSVFCCLPVQVMLDVIEEIKYGYNTLFCITTFFWLR